MTNFVGTPDDDTFYGGATDDTADGFDGDDTLYGGGGLDTLNGGNDNDYLDGGLGADTLNGGNGNDRVVGDAGDTVNGGSGLDLLALDLSTVASNFTKVLDFSGGALNTFGATKFQNVEVLQLTTGSGNDTLTFNSDAIYGSNAYGGYWYGGSGNDHAIVNWSDQAFSISGSAGGVSIGTTSIAFGGVEKFDFSGGSGNDTLAGGADVDSLVGNAGNDTLTGNAGADTLDGGDGNDTIYAGNSADNAGIDIIKGGIGDDDIRAAFKDSIDGGQGRDSLTLDLGDRSTNATLAFNPLASNTIQTTTFTHVENLYLTTGSGDDSLSITSTAIQISTTTDDAWDGGSGTDTFTANMTGVAFGLTMNLNSVQTGDFYFSVSAVERFIYTGGSGNDSISGAALDDTLTGGGGGDTMYGGLGDDTMSGGVGRDGMHGGDGVDTMDGGDDRDSMFGEVGNDKLTGGDGRDTLYGGTEKDNLKGGAGNDFLQGDDGIDTLDGGADADKISYVAVTNSTGKSYDIVANFDFNAVDKFHFNGGVTGYDGIDKTGKLDNSTFNGDLVSELGTLGQHHAKFFQPNSGDHAGETFLIVDANNVVGYQANEDYVINLTTPANINSADLTDFQG